MHTGRLSDPETRYFLTICTVGRKEGLTNVETASLLHQAWDEMVEQGDASLFCRTIMPNHVHVLLRLGTTLNIGQVVGKWKTRTRVALRQCGLAWQRDFFERRLRPDDEQEPFGLYIFLNPYAGHLLKPDAVWPCWKLDSPKSFIFPTLLKDGGYPHVAWIAQNQKWKDSRGW